MSKKKSKNNIKHINTPHVIIENKSGKTILKDKWVLFFIVLITLFVYFPALKNDFIINWDDKGYIHDYEPIHKLNIENVKTIFSEFYKGNYHPLTTLFYAVEYFIVGTSPFLFHLNNLILHLCNVILVFVFIKKLSGQQFIAAFCAVFFGIHPMHVESVAWISERKDVLYTFFFLISLINYQKYLQAQQQNKKKFLFYSYSLLCFILSLLSKSAAVSLPLVLLLIDYFNRRQFIIKNLIDKIPYFLLSLVFGIIAIASQKETGAIQNLKPIYSVIDRFFIVSYAFVTYIYKLFIPINLSAMYSYPYLHNGKLPLEYYLSGIIAVIIITLFVVFLRKKRSAIFGFLFFIATIILVLQIIPVGGAVLAERYTYVPYIGLFFIIGTEFYNFTKKQKPVLFNFFLFLGIVVILIFSFLTYDRIKAWKNGETLFTDVIKKNPNLPFAYGNRAFYYKENKMWGKAINDYNIAIKLNPDEKGIFANRGAALYQIGKIKEAAEDFEQALKREPDDPDVLLSMANTYSSLKDYSKAIPYYNKYLKIKTNNPKAWLWRAVAYYYENKFDSTIMDADNCLRLNPNDDEGYYWKALALNKKGNYDSAIMLLDKSISLNPKRGEVYSWRGLTKQNKGLYKESISDFDLAIKYSPNDAAAYLNRSVAYYNIKNYDAALKDAEIAIKLGQNVNPEYYKILKNINRK